MLSPSKPPAGIWLQVWVCLGLVLITLAVFAPTVTFSFLEYDDNVYVVTNPHVLAGLTGPNIGWAFRSINASNWHPLTWLSHMLDCQLYGRWAGGHHLTSLLLHLANTLLLFRLWQRITGALWRSAFVAALFAVHPLHVESVAWVAERKDVLSAFFFLLTLWAYVRYAEKSVVSGQWSVVSSDQTTDYGLRATDHGPRSTGGSRIFYLLSLLFFALGLMSKPMLVTLPFVLLLLDYWPLGRMQKEEGRMQKAEGRRRFSFILHPSSFILLEKLPFLALSTASSLATVYAQSQSGALLPLEKFPLGLRLANALVSYARYLGKTLWPEHLAAFYPHPVHWPAWQVVGAGLLLAGVSIAAIALARRAPYLFTGWFWYLGMLIPVIGLVQVGSQAMADRYMYLPALGLFLATAWGVPALIPPARAADSSSALPARCSSPARLGAPRLRCDTGRWRNPLPPCHPGHPQQLCRLQQSGRGAGPTGTPGGSHPGLLGISAP